MAVNDPIFKWLVSWVNTNPSAETYKDIAVSAGLAMLVLPFILLAAPAGYCADRFSKRTIIVACKVAEVILMILGVMVILHGNVWLMFFTLFLMGSSQRDIRAFKIRLDSGNRPPRAHLRRQRLDRHDHDLGHRVGHCGRRIFIRMDQTFGTNQLVAVGLDDCLRGRCGTGDQPADSPAGTARIPRENSP